MATETPETDSPACQVCAHYYITWDASFPYGCRAMGFKSKRQPSLDVEEASLTRCKGFEVRTRRKK